MRPSFPRILVILVLLPIALGVHLARSDTVERVKSHPPRATTWIPDPHPEIATAELGAFFDGVARQMWIDAELARIAAEEEAARQAAIQEALRARQRSAPSAPRVVSGDCAAVAEVVGWGTVSRESGGNPGATNGIYLGCAQIGTPWWNGACAGLDWTNVADQATCARIVLNTQGPSAWATTWGG